MHPVSVQDARVLVLAEGEGGGSANAAGHLFEDFVARLMSLYGYEAPQRRNLRTSARGMELDISVRHQLSGHLGLVECKAYASPVSADYLVQFFGTLSIERMTTDPQIQGFFVALPRLTSQGDEKARQIMEQDKGIRVLTAADIVNALKDKRLIIDQPTHDKPTDDHAVVVTEHGLYSCAIELDPVTRNASKILVWSPESAVPTPVLEMLSSSVGYGGGIPAVDFSRSRMAVVRQALAEPDPVIAPVAGSGSDFEYQLPASPKYFIGRKSLVSDLERLLEQGGSVIVLNARSGWGKSSLALKIKAIVQDGSRGYSTVLDARTASGPGYITASLRHAAMGAVKAGVLDLPGNAAWATLASALRTLSRAKWVPGKRIVIFFDQFENVFKDPSLTREFRDLAVGAREVGEGLVVGFAWKTDLVGWTEDHPFQLRDEIRANAAVLTLDPLGPREVETLLRRLEKALEQPLVPDLRQRLREYSQGLPWLLKKLASHLIREARSGATQEQLLSEALNVQNLFEADLAELQPIEQDALKYIARFAPVAAVEVTERVQPAVVQSLLDRRLIVQVGERLDTYWDTFRDFLNTGRVPVEDSYILRLGPRSVARLLAALPLSGNGSVPEIAAKWGTSDKAVFNISRELRLLGVAMYEPNRVRILDEIWNADDKEGAIRRRVTGSLRRHRAYTRLLQLAERGNNIVPIATFARELPHVFPAVSQTSAWPDYARVFVQWLEYAGLAHVSDQDIETTPEGDDTAAEALYGARPIVRAKRAFPHAPPGPAISLLKRVADGEVNSIDQEKPSSVRDLLKLGAIEVRDGAVIATSGLINSGAVNARRLRSLLDTLPGCTSAMAALDVEPALSPTRVGEIIRAAYGADWSDATVLAAGKHMRAWARLAGVETLVRQRVPENESHSSEHDSDLLF